MGVCGCQLRRRRGVRLHSEQGGPRACSTRPLAPHRGDGGVQRVSGARPGQCLLQGGREKPAVGVRPSVLQTDGEALRRQGLAAGPLGARRKGWGPLGLEVGRRGCPCYISGPRLLHLPRTPRRLRRSSWPTRWRPEWRPGTTASLPSGRGARSVCCRRGPGVGPALSVAWLRGPAAPAGPHPASRSAQAL